MQNCSNLFKPQWWVCSGQFGFADNLWNGEISEEMYSLCCRIIRHTCLHLTLLSADIRNIRVHNWPEMLLFMWIFQNSQSRAIDITAKRTGITTMWADPRVFLNRNRWDSVRTRWQGDQFLRTRRPDSLETLVRFRTPWNKRNNSFTNKNNRIPHNIELTYILKRISRKQ